MKTERGAELGGEQVTPSATSKIEEIDDRLRAFRRGMVLSHWASVRPDQIAVIYGDEQLTYAELNARCNRLARFFSDQQLGEGDGVALLCSNRLEFIEVWGAASRSGLRLTPINIHLQADEIGYIVDDCKARAIFFDATLGASVAEAARASTAEVRVSIGGDLPGFERFEDAVAGRSGEDIEDPRQGMVMFYTSGTTGRPKGVYREPLADNRLENVNLHRYEEGDLNLLTGPMYHAAPLAFSIAMPLAFGAGVVVMERWDSEEALRLIDEHGVTHTHMVPTMFHRLLSLSEEVRSRYRLERLRFVLHGAAPCPVEVKKRLIEWLGPIVYEYYAATEGLGTSVDSKTWLERPGTVGRPRPEGQVLVGDDEADPLPPGEVGLVWLRAPERGRFEYFGDPGKTRSAYRGDYFTLGDMGYMDEDGFLYLTDRSANLIISGGVNIYPAEVDGILLQHPAVADAATIGVPHDEWGEEVLAVVELKPDWFASTELAGELIEFCRERIAHYKCPRRVDFVDELPRSDNGKIYKRHLREEYRRKSRDA